MRIEKKPGRQLTLKITRGTMNMNVIELDHELIELSLSGTETELINKMLVFSEHYPNAVEVKRLDDGGLVAIMPAVCIGFESSEEARKNT